MESHEDSLQPQRDSTQPVQHFHQAYGPSVAGQEQAIGQTAHSAQASTTPLQAPLTAALVASTDGSQRAQQQMPLPEMQSAWQEQQPVMQPASWHHHNAGSSSTPNQASAAMFRADAIAQHFDKAQQADQGGINRQTTHHWVQDSATQPGLHWDDNGFRHSVHQEFIHPHLRQTVSLQERVQGQDDSGTRSFMRPTVSSLVHSASRQKSLRRSHSEHVV